MFIFFLPYFILEVYTILFIIFISIRIIKERKVNGILVGINTFWLAILFYLRYLVHEQKLVFFDEYVDGQKSAGAGMANVGAWLKNMSILFLALLISQIVFWIIYRRLRGNSEKTSNLSGNGMQ